MNKRTLRLRRETLAELDAAALAEVAGAAPDLSGTSCPVAACTRLSEIFMTCNCQTGNC
jgi:hypothetical protein